MSDPHPAELILVSFEQEKEEDAQLGTSNEIEETLHVEPINEISAKLRRSEEEEICHQRLLNK